MTAYEKRIEQTRARDADLRKWIIVTPGICSGSPRLKETRLRVKDIIGIVMNKEEEILYKDYQYVTKEGVDACIIYDEDNKKLVSSLS